MYGLDILVLPLPAITALYYFSLNIGSREQCSRMETEKKRIASELCFF